MLELDFGPMKEQVGSIESLAAGSRSLDAKVISRKSRFPSIGRSHCDVPPRLARLQYSLLSQLRIASGSECRFRSCVDGGELHAIIFV